MERRSAGAPPQLSRLSPGRAGRRASRGLDRGIALALIGLRVGAAAALVGAAMQLLGTPMAGWVVDRPIAEVTVRLEQAVARRVSPDWLSAEIAASLAETPPDWPRIETLRAAAERHGVEPTAEVRAALASAESGRARVEQVALSCLFERDVPREAAALACRLATELTVLGDVRSLSFGAHDVAAGRRPDYFDLGLAAVGLAATGAVVVSAGGSAPVKLGVAALKTARQADLLQPPLRDFVVATARHGIGPDGRLAPGALRPLGRLAEDYGTVVAQIAPARVADIASGAGVRAAADAVRLLAYVETAEDATRLARVARAMGPRTADSLQVLGKARVFRATLRLSRAASEALALSLAALGQLLATAALSITGTALRRHRPARP
ncbi:MAG: hypothetical protein AAGE18_18430 [Pseudomonadota bacterium]